MSNGARLADTGYKENIHRHPPALPRPARRLRYAPGSHAAQTATGGPERTLHQANIADSP